MKEKNRMTDILVSYFSATGETKKDAESISKACGADLFAIEPAHAYSEADLDWMNTNSRSSKEEADPDFRPTMKGKVSNLDQYSTVFVGFPIWWYREPNIIRTFLESGDFSGKKLIVFATSGGSGLKDCAKHVQSFAPGAKVVEGRVVNSPMDAVNMAAELLRA